MKKNKSPYRFLWLIPGVLVLSALVVGIAAWMDLDVLANGYPILILTAIALFVMGAVSLVVAIVAVILTVGAVRKRRSEDCEAARR